MKYLCLLNLIYSNIQYNLMSDFEDRTIRCIDDVLEQLGIEVRRALLFHLRREKGIKHYEIFENPVNFINALHTILGDAANNIENEIIKKIEDEFNINNNNELDLQHLIIFIKKEYTPKKDIEKVESNYAEDDLTYMLYRKSSKKDE